jgi:predicted transcriptional regulator
MCEAIAQYLDQKEQRESLREAALQSWQPFQATGLHATGGEVDRWLRKQESGQTVAPPKLHR